MRKKVKKVFDGIKQKDIKTLRWVFLLVGIAIIISLIIFRPGIPEIFWNFTTSFFNSSVNMTGNVIRMLFLLL